MNVEREVTTHYVKGDLLARLKAALAEDGVDPEHPTLEALAPYDQFHGRGQEATVEVADRMPAGPGDHLLDVGCGIGGPARYVAARFGCRVTGIDLTPEFCEVAREVTRMTGLGDRVSFRQANALSMPFPDASHDGAYSMNVSMNIADKAGFFREIHRVLKPGGWLLLSEIARGEGGEIEFPTPWAAGPATSFLSTPDDTRRFMTEAGFEVSHLRSTLPEMLDFGARSRAMVARGERPPQRTVMLIHGELAPVVTANTARAFGDGRLVPIEAFARKKTA
jgi:ubiquinone/menaquinone biosynthesis C-methylase UbiE